MIIKTMSFVKDMDDWSAQSNTGYDWRVFTMNKDNLKILIKDLEFAIAELKAEVYADPSSYIDNENASERFALNDDDGETD